VAAMEKVLDIYKRPYNPDFPMVCMDESPKQLIREIHAPVAAAAGRLERYDYEYERCGVCNVFMASEPLAAKRFVKVTERKTKPDWALFVKDIAENYKSAKRITLIMDNLGTHKPGAFYEAFTPQEAKEILDRFEFVYTPKHGSWLNMAEIELNVLMGQCLDRRIDNISTIKSEVIAWQRHRNNLNSKINWHFTMEKARVKLRRLYPTLDC
jgi:transposase